jgi:hypothetical protein
LTASEIVSTTSDAVDDAMRLRQSSVERFSIHLDRTRDWENDERSC